MQKTSDLIWQDTQHQVLFELIDRIKEVPFDPDILVRLKLYAEHHFILEETYMLELRYPHADKHITAHDRFREELAAMLETDPAMGQNLQVSLSDFLYKWLKLHVLGEPMDLLPLHRLLRLPVLLKRPDPLELAEAFPEHRALVRYALDWMNAAEAEWRHRVEPVPLRT